MKWNAESFNFPDKRNSKGKSCNVERKNMKDFCDINNLQILNWKFKSDTCGEFTFINELGSSVINYALAPKCIISNALHF